MSKRFEAIIHWLSEEEGGRRTMPIGDKYAPIIKITKPLFKSDEAWSIFVCNKQIVSLNKTQSEVEYLSDMAPDNLTCGVEFELFEGSKLVGKGVALREISKDN